MAGNNVNIYPQSSEGYPLSVAQDDNELALGNRFSAFLFTTIAGSAETNIIAITSNEVKLCDAWFSVETDKAGVYYLYEGAICSGGSALTAFNNNRNSSTISDATVVADPTIATVGTFIGAHVIGSTTGGASKSGGSSSTNKYQLKKNTTYLLQFTADGVNTRVTQGIYWREHNS